MPDIEVEFMPLVIRKLPHHFGLGVPSSRRREASWHHQSVCQSFSDSGHRGLKLRRLLFIASLALLVSKSSMSGVKSFSGHLCSYHKLDIVSHRREFIFLKLIPTHLSAR